jgi:hypothetical protein
MHDREEVGERPWIRDGRAQFQAVFDTLNDDHGRTFPTWRPTGEALHDAAGRARHEKPAPPPPCQVLVVPGLGASLFGPLGRPLDDALEHLRSLGHSAEVLRVSALGSSRRNARLLDELFRESEREPDRPTIALGYSKGATDLIVALATYPEVARKLTAVVSLAGSIGGSPHADRLPGPLRSLLALGHRWLPLGGAASLARSSHRAWLEASRLPAEVGLYSVVAHAGSKRISGVLRPAYERLRLIDPRNDSQVLRDDQIVPGSTLLAELNADHWAVALPLTQRWPALRRLGLGANDFPREILLEAIITIVMEDLRRPQSGADGR